MTATLDRPAPTDRAPARWRGRVPSLPAWARRQQARPRSRPPAAPSQADDTLAFMSTTAVMCCLVAGWMLAQMLVLGGVAQARAQAALYDDLRRELAAGTASLGPVTPVGEPVALLSVPRLGLRQVVVEGTASGDLLAGPGHLRSTVLPGQQGTSAVFGRAATYGGPFGRITELETGDSIIVVTAQGEKRFEVLGVRRAGDPLPQPRAEDAARLVLVSSEGESRLPGLAPERVVYVDAEADEAYPTAPGTPGAVPDPEQAMGTETGALPLLALCLGLLLATTCGVVAARQRFSAALVWVVTTPVVLALAWVTTDVVMRLLPNLL